MPKKGKGRYKGGANRLDPGSDEENVFADNVSVISNVSSGSLLKEEVVNGAEKEGVDELSQEEVFEEKLREAMDLATQKSAQGRTMALESMCTAFLKKFIPDFVEDRRMTLTDIAERSMKKGKSAEQVTAAKLAVLLCVQLGGSGSGEEVIKDLRSVFITLMSDPSAPMKTRAAAASALGDCCFLASQPEDYEDILMSLEKIFNVKSVANAPEDFYGLQTSALSAWTLLYTLLPSSRAFKSLESHMQLFENLLEAGNVELRIAAGEAVVVLYEAAYDHDEEEIVDLVEPLIPGLQELAKDSAKYRSKKERKEQKSSFRDILKTIEDDEEFYEKVAFSKRETLEITSWGMKIQYEQLCKVVASGMNLHLSENELIRSIFSLGDPLPSLAEVASNRPSKHERHHANQVAFKWRTQTRGKNRDKRSAVV